jgi:hypothetical protein
LQRIETRVFLSFKPPWGRSGTLSFADTSVYGERVKDATAQAPAFKKMNRGAAKSLLSYLCAADAAAVYKACGM